MLRLIHAGEHSGNLRDGINATTPGSPNASVPSRRRPFASLHKVMRPDNKVAAELEIRRLAFDLR
jgi:hypothetical protein